MFIGIFKLGMGFWTLSTSRTQERASTRIRKRIKSIFCEIIFSRKGLLRTQVFLDTTLWRWSSGFQRLQRRFLRKVRKRSPEDGAQDYRITEFSRSALFEHDFWNTIKTKSFSSWGAKNTLHEPNLWSSAQILRINGYLEGILLKIIYRR